MLFDQGRRFGAFGDQRPDALIAMLHQLAPFTEWFSNAVRQIVETPDFSKPKVGDPLRAGPLGNPSRGKPKRCFGEKATNQLVNGEAILRCQKAMCSINSATPNFDRALTIAGA